MPTYEENEIRLLRERMIIFLLEKDQVTTSDKIIEKAETYVNYIINGKEEDFLGKIGLEIAEEVEARAELYKKVKKDGKNVKKKFKS